jgi:hypothetical protein
VLAALHSTRVARVTADADLADAREALIYWETRARTLPRHAIRRRREAHVLAARWRDRVAEAERAAYGAGLLGALLLLAAERRLPQGVRHTGRLVARRTAQAAALVCAAIIALVLVGAFAVVEVVAALVRALAG